MSRDATTPPPAADVEQGEDEPDRGEDGEDLGRRTPVPRRGSRRAQDRRRQQQDQRDGGDSRSREQHRAHPVAEGAPGGLDERAGVAPVGDGVERPVERLAEPHVEDADHHGEREHHSSRDGEDHADASPPRRQHQDDGQEHQELERQPQERGRLELAPDGAGR